MSPDQVVVLEDPIVSWPSSVGSPSSAGHPLGNFEGCQPLPRCELLARVVFVSRACSSRYSCSGRSMGAWVKQQCLLPVDTRAVFLEGLVGIWPMDCSLYFRNLRDWLLFMSFRWRWNFFRHRVVMLSSPGGRGPPDGRVVQVQYEESQLLMVEHRRSAGGYGLSMVELIASRCVSSSCSCKV